MLPVASPPGRSLPRHAPSLTLLLLLLLAAAATTARAATGTSANRHPTRLAKQIEDLRFQPKHFYQRKRTDPLGAQITDYSGFYETYKLGHKIRLSCEAFGNPRPDIHWKKDMLDIVVWKGMTNIQMREEHPADRPNMIQSYLEIEPALIKDQGDYVCEAVNNWGGDSRRIKVRYVYRRRKRK